MIVKLQSSGDWIYAEASRVKIQRGHSIGYLKEQYETCADIHLRGILQVGFSPDAYGDIEKYYKQEASHIMLWDKNSNDVKRIITDLPGYLMNNDGKTIDRIN